jgi:hypothetical protein
MVGPAGITGTTVQLCGNAGDTEPFEVGDVVVEDAQRDAEQGRDGRGLFV